MLRRVKPERVGGGFPPRQVAGHERSLKPLRAELSQLRCAVNGFDVCVFPFQD